MATQEGVWDLIVIGEELYTVLLNGCKLKKVAS